MVALQDDRIRDVLSRSKEISALPMHRERLAQKCDCSIDASLALHRPI